VVGSPYVITAGNATGGTFTASNYTIAYVNGGLTVTPLVQPLSVAGAPETSGIATAIVPAETPVELLTIVPTLPLPVMLDAVPD